MVLMAMVSYHWIEKPMRENFCGFKTWKTIIAGAGCSVGSLGIVLLIIKPLAALLYVGDAEIARGKYRSFEASAILSLKPKSCFGSIISGKEFNRCRVPLNGSRKTLYFVGDSHSESLWRAAERIARFSKSNLFLYGYNSTPFPAIKNRLSRKYDGREQFKSLQKYMRSVDGIREGDILFITLYPRSFANSHINAKQRESLDMWMQEVLNLASFLETRKASMVLFTPTPVFENRFEQCTHQWFNRLSRLSCNNPKSKYISEYANVLDVLEEIAASRKNVYIFDLLEVMCPEGVCSYNRRGLPLYKDEHHINDYAAGEIVAPRMISFLESKGLVSGF
jgi:hypothetical protein